MKLNSVQLFDGLDEQQKHIVESLATSRNYAKNSVILREGEPGDAMYFITRGKVRVYVSEPGGKEFTLSTMEAGEHFGELALLDDAPRSASVMALEDSNLSVINKSDFTRVTLENPAIGVILMKNLAARIRELTERAKSLALQDVYGRIRTLIMDLAEPASSNAPEDDPLTVPEKLTQQDIANRVGSSREMVARILKDLQTGGYIGIEKKYITVNKKLPESY